MEESYGLASHSEQINSLLARYGVRFGLYKGGEFKEQLFPFDVISRKIERDEFAHIEKGLIQRVTALNLFLRDLYNEKKIVKDKIIPEDFIYSSSGYNVKCEGFVPVKDVYSHISGIDLVKGKDGEWYILEDNLRIPSGASYPMIARELTRRCSPQTFQKAHIEDNRNYADMLKAVMDNVSCGGVNAVLTPGRFNAAYFEHSYLAEKTGSLLVTGQDLEVEDGVLYFTSYGGKKERIGALYRRISDEYLDPVEFNHSSVIGVPHLFDAYRKHNVAVINAFGNGVADDKGLYYFVPKMIKYYLGEEPILSNAKTYLPYYDEDFKETLANFDHLVVKDVAEAGGYGVVFVEKLNSKEKEDFLALYKSERRRFIAQEVIDFEDLDTYVDGKVQPRKADLRAFVLSDGSVKVWKSGLTRFSCNADSFVVNSSQGGGFKDTWVFQ